MALGGDADLPEAQAWDVLAQYRVLLMSLLEPCARGRNGIISAPPLMSSAVNAPVTLRLSTNDAKNRSVAQVFKQLKTQGPEEHWDEDRNSCEGMIHHCT